MTHDILNDIYSDVHTHNEKKDHNLDTSKAHQAVKFLLNLFCLNITLLRQRYTRLLYLQVRQLSSSTYNFNYIKNFNHKTLIFFYVSSLSGLVVAITLSVISFTTRRHSLPAAHLVLTCRGQSVVALAWSVQRIGDLPRGLTPSTRHSALI